MPALAWRPYRDPATQIQSQINILPPHLRGQVEFLLEVDQGQKTSGDKRQALFNRSKGNRVCFVDDDDSFDEHYVSDLLTRSIECRDVSVITFNLKVTLLNRRRGKLRRSEETWKLGLQSDQREKGLMSANHLCAWRRDVAELVAWCPHLGYADDQVWYQPLINHPTLSLTESHIDRILYFYQCSRLTTSNQTNERINYARSYVGEGLRCYLVRGEVFIEVGNGHTKPHPERVTVRDRENNILTLPSTLQHYHSVKII